MGFNEAKMQISKSFKSYLSSSFSHKLGLICYVVIAMIFSEPCRAEMQCAVLFVNEAKPVMSIYSDKQKQIFEKEYEKAYHREWQARMQTEFLAIKSDPTEQKEKLDILEKLGFDEKQDRQPTIFEFVVNYVETLNRASVPVNERLLPAVTFGRRDRETGEFEFYFMTPGIDPWPKDDSFERIPASIIFNIDPAAVFEAMKRGRYPLLEGDHDLFHFVSFLKNPEYMRQLRQLVNQANSGADKEILFERLRYLNEWLTLANPNQKQHILKTSTTVSRSTKKENFLFKDFQKTYEDMKTDELMTQAHRMLQNFPQYLIAYGGAAVRSNEVKVFAERTNQEGFPELLLNPNNVDPELRSWNDSPRLFSNTLQQLIHNLTDINQTEMIPLIRLQLARMDYFLYKGVTGLNFSKIMSGVLPSQGPTDPEVLQFFKDILGDNSLFYQSLLQSYNP
jgi:hypothetical protein